MTLEEAHKLQRKELLSLRAENARLKKQAAGVLTIEEKEKLERHIRHLEQIIKTNSSQYELARKSWKLTSDHCHDLEIEVIDLKEQLHQLHEENELLRIRAQKAEEEVQMLTGANKKLEKKVNTNFENSSLPSSATPFRKKIPNNRKPTGKKPGAQPGHKSHTAPRLSTTKKPVFIPAPEEFFSNPNIYPTGKSITKQLIDIQINVQVQDFIADEYRNRITGARLHAPFPEGIVNKVNYGPSIKAFAFLLNNYYNVSVSKTRQCIHDLTKGVVTLSTGTINQLSSVFSAATELERAKIFSVLTHADVLYSDATVSNINGSRKAVILCTDKEQVLYQHFDHKGHEGLSKSPVKDFTGTLVHDHDLSFYSYGTDHQECLAHVLRYLVGAMENEPTLTWHKKMHQLLQKMIHLSKKCKAGIPPEKLEVFLADYDSILSIALAEYTAHPPDKAYMDGYNLQKRLREYKSAHLFFLTHPEVDPTNNISERGLRKFKRKQKQAVVLRSSAGGQHICDALSIIETARLQGQNIYDVVESSFTK